MVKIVIKGEKISYLRQEKYNFILSFFTLLASLFLIFIHSFSFAEDANIKQAQITNIDSQNSLITINLGSDNKIEAGMPVSILHQEAKFGQFLITNVDKNTSVIKLTPEIITSITNSDTVEIDLFSWIFTKGIKEYQIKDFDGAIASFKEVSKGIYGHEPSVFNAAICFIQKEKYDEAIKTLQEAAKYNPYNLFTEKFIADLYILLKKYPQAEKKLKEIIERNAQDTDAHLKLAFLAIKTNKITIALDELTFVRNLSPNEAVSRINLAGLLLQKGDLTKAQEYLNEAESKGIVDNKLSAFSLMLKGYMYKKNGQEKESQEAFSTAQNTAAEWKILKKVSLSLAELQLELASHSLELYAWNELLTARLMDFTQSEVSKRTVERILKEKELAASTSSSGTNGKQPLELPFNISAELNQTLENYDRNPATSNPINDINTTTNLKIDGNEKGIYVKNEFEWFYNRWDHTDLDYFKTNIKDNNNDEIDIGKFSSKNFPSLVSHPTIEQGGRWWHKLDLPKFKTEAAKAFLPDNVSEYSQENNAAFVPSLSKIFSDNYLDNRPFKTTEITVLRGRSKKPINIDRQKSKNDRTYETSGQFEQWVNALHIMTKPSDISELGFSYSRVKDDELSAITSATTYPLESEALGVDGKIDLLDGKLKADGEYGWANYDSNLYSEDKNKQDGAILFGLDYKPNSAWEYTYDLTRIGKNFKVEGAYQTEDKLTHTLTGKFSQSKNTPWSLRSLDVKYEPAYTNLQKRGDLTRTYYKTFQPKASFNLPQDIKLSLDYKWYHEEYTCNCTRYKTSTLKTDVEYEIKPIKTTLKPSYTYERKNDLVTSPTDERRKEYGVSLENTLVKNLTVKFSWDRDMKSYVGLNTKSYDEKKYSFETKYAFIPGRLESTFKASIDDKGQTDTNDTELDTLDYYTEYTSKSGETKFYVEFERKWNIYRPWSDSSAYKQNYVKVKLTQKF